MNRRSSRVNHLRQWMLILLACSPLGFAADFEVVVVQSPAAERASEGLSFAGIPTHPRRPVASAARLALAESAPSYAALKVTTALETLDLDPDRPLAPQLESLQPRQLVILDLPEPVFRKAVDALKQKPVVLVNVRHRATTLRDDLCQPNLFHTLPSDRMYFDALGQFLIYRGWRRVLVVHGPSSADRERTETLVTSMEKFGASVVDVREFTLSHHPDDRDQNKPEFLTGGVSYDVVAVIDTARDYGRYIQYSTRQPRPVVGDVGLVPRAWHAALERYGAPQLNQRYQSMEGTSPGLMGMTDPEFATWAAVKFVTNTLDSRHLQSGTLDLMSVFTDPEGRVDLYKGTRGSFRTWNQQLRQPMLLAAESAVIAVAPMPKFLHPRHYVDTLGLDQAESPCKIR